MAKSINPIEPTKLTKRSVDALAPRAERYDVRDTDLPGFLVRVNPSGDKSFAVWYRAGKGRTATARRFTIGTYGAVTVEQARDLAKKTLADVTKGEDPAAARRGEKGVPTVAALGDAFLDDVDMRRKPTTAAEYRRMWEKHVAPALGRRKVDRVTAADVAKLQRSLKTTPYGANRVVALLGSFFTFAAGQGACAKHWNPAHDVKPFPERERERFLTPAEVQRLGDALTTAERVGLPPAPQVAKHRPRRATAATIKHRAKRADAKTRVDAINPSSPFAIAAIRFLLLSGWRASEALTLKWSDLDEARGSATLVDTKTGKSVRHLGAPALALLAALPKVAGNPYVFVGRAKGEPLKNISVTWCAVRHAANLDDVRLHDLRHSFASTIASGGGSLLLIGKLLGHKNQATSARYAHLFADPIRATADTAANSLASWLTGSKQPPTGPALVVDAAKEA